ncbi:TonB-dependent receptor [Arenibacter sp. ARW7G5Y1]|uniref:TonB-dependent receptor n=1 Tax=Arenibacter sp. ARW7G5Y1 TaxID=2135619 RepID=UPI000D76F822|nr:TonB-dependent receptor [Arenibacter sp. ARW7G5Y1]PXX25732.1 TonB-linked SusC/RagA family outer membrane protein [Arenibacter sp. ARW7G5Y1]
MNKKNIRLGMQHALYPNISLKMKLTTLFLIIALFRVQANTYSQVAKITLDLDSVGLMTVFEEIEAGSEYKFLGNQDVIDRDRVVSVHVKKERIHKVLTDLFSGTNISFRILDRQIILKNEPNLQTQFGPMPKIDKIAKPQLTVSGTIVDNNGTPLSGANVVEKGTVNGVTADFDGQFEIELSSANPELVVSYLGFATKEILVNGQTNMTITLQESAAGLEEVVVVGYGQVRKSDLTGSVASIKGEAVSLQAVGNPVQALSGVATGVQILQNSGQPGSGLSVLIRGGNSLLGGNNPLYVVDGFPIIGDLSSINPNDILSIEILKDASSTAIYGARGANGVVIVSTKKGKEGKTSIEYNGYTGFQKVNNTIDMLNAKEFATLANVRASNDNIAPYFTNAEIASFENGTNWQDEIFQNAVIQNHSITVSGGNDKTVFNVSGNYFNQEGIIINSGYEYLQLRSSLEHKINSKWKVSFNNILSRKKNNNIFSNNTERGAGVLSGALISPPTVSVFNSDGEYSNVRPYAFSPDIVENPVAMALERKQLSRENALLLNIIAEGKITKDLVLYSSIGVQYENTRGDNYSPSIFQPSATGSASISYREFTDIVNENLLTYSKEINNDHDLKVMGGITSQKTSNQSLSASSTGFLSDILENNSIQAGSSPGTPISASSEYSILSGLGRLNYGYKGKYLLTTSIRADGSSVFGKANKWGYFPSAALAWRVSEENFLKENDLIGNLKLRASWGKTGNTAVSPYQSLSILSSSQTVFDDNINIGYAPGSSMPNPNLKWETTAQTDFGVDFGLFRNRFQVTFDYYYKKTEDLLASIPVILSSGYTSQTTNLGSMENRGFEVSLDSRVLEGDFSWDLGVNFSSNRNKVLSLPEGGDIFGVGLGNALPAMSLVREGHPVGVFYGLVEDGLTDDGLINYVDTDVNGTINSLDRQIIGDPNPDFIFGINSNMSYKNFGLTVLVSGSQGNDILNYNLSNVADGFSFGINQIRDVLGNYWTAENPDPNAKYPKISSNTRYQGSDRFIEDGSYVQIKNVRLSYTLKGDTFKSLPIHNSQIFVNIQNLATFTNYSFYSPTLNTHGGGISKGIDQFGYPDTRTFMLGVRINL